MELKDAIRGRCSVRKFLSDDIPDQEIVALIENAIRAPNAGNRQTWHFAIIKNQGLKNKMSVAVAKEIERLIKLGFDFNEKQVSRAAKGATFFNEAPVVIAITTQKYRTVLDELLISSGKPEAELDDLRCRPDLQSVAAAIQNMLLSAYAKGYGGCWMTGPMLARKKLEELLDIQAPRALAALVAIGKPFTQPSTGARMAAERVITFIK